jgi:hypothetical protein
MTDATVRTHKYSWPSIVVAAIFGILYAYILWTAIGNLVQLPATLGSVTPWWVLILDVALPVVAFVFAFLVGRRQPIGIRALLFFIGLAVISGAYVSSVAYVQTH